MISKLEKEFYEAILSLKTESECQKFFLDACTKKEIIEMSQRLRVAKLLKEGKSYLEVVKETGCSTATISRVSKCLQSDGGYQLILKRLEGKE